MYFEKINEITASAAKFGSRETSHGTRLFGHVPHVAPEAWFHVLFKGLTSSDSIKRQIGRALHPDFETFLTNFNGVSLFSGRLEIYGERLINDRRGDASWQPFDIVIANTIERPRNSPESRVYIGSAEEHSLALDSLTGSVVLLPRRRSEPVLGEWENLEAMFSNKIDELRKKFDPIGRPLD